MMIALKARVPRNPPALTALSLFLNFVVMILIAVSATSAAEGRDLVSQVTEIDQIPRLGPDYPVPNEPHMLFYVERSVNSNTVVYAANLGETGAFDPHKPVIAYWRWYNVDGHRKELNLAERMLAYGVTGVTQTGPRAFSFKIAALPERTIFVGLDSDGHPEAFGQVGKRSVKLTYIYLEVDNSGLFPDVTAMNFFGVDKASGQAIHERLTWR